MRGGEAAPRGTAPHFSPGAKRALGAGERGQGRNGEGPNGNDPHFSPSLMGGLDSPSALEFDMGSLEWRVSSETPHLGFLWDPASDQIAEDKL